MTGEELQAIRKAAAPEMTQAAFARVLGYKDTNSYHKYERGQRPVPPLLAKLAEMIRLHGVPDAWRL